MEKEKKEEILKYIENLKKVNTIKEIRKIEGQVLEILEKFPDTTEKEEKD